MGQITMLVANFQVHVDQQVMHGKLQRQIEWLVAFQQSHRAAMIPVSARHQLKLQVHGHGASVLCGVSV